MKTRWAQGLAWMAVLPAALWVRWHERILLKKGRPLTSREAEEARRVGVRAVHRVRILNVSEIPTPAPTFGRAFFKTRGWMPGEIAGMTLGYGIYLHSEWGSQSVVLSHELVHVAQYERLGGILGFLLPYLKECLTEGYPQGALEAEAHAKQRDF